MGEERDKLIRQTGGRVSAKDDAQAYREYMRLRAESGNLPPHMQKLIKQMQTDADTAADAADAAADNAAQETAAPKREIDVNDVLYRSPYKGWLVDQNYLRQTENAAKEIWTIIPLLTFAVQPDSVLFQGVNAGIQRGCKHKIFMPDTPEVHKNIAEYIRLHRPLPGQVEFILIPDDEYVFHTVLSLYNPQSDNPTAIEYLPAEHLATWVRMDEDYTRRIINAAKIVLRKFRNDSYILTESILRHIQDDK